MQLRKDDIFIYLYIFLYMEVTGGWREKQLNNLPAILMILIMSEICSYHLDLLYTLWILPEVLNSLA